MTQNCQRFKLWDAICRYDNVRYNTPSEYEMFIPRVFSMNDINGEVTTANVNKNKVTYTYNLKNRHVQRIARNYVNHKQSRVQSLFIDESGSLFALSDPTSIIATGVKNIINNAYFFLLVFRDDTFAVLNYQNQIIQPTDKPTVHKIYVMFAGFVVETPNNHVYVYRDMSLDYLTSVTQLDTILESRVISSVDPQDKPFIKPAAYTTQWAKLPVRVQSVRVAYDFAVMVTLDNQLYVVGNPLNMGQKEGCVQGRSPTRPIEKIVCTLRSTAVLDAYGQVFAWGHGFSGTYVDINDVTGLFSYETGYYGLVADETYFTMDSESTIVMHPGLTKTTVSGVYTNGLGILFLLADQRVYAYTHDGIRGFIPNLFGVYRIMTNYRSFCCLTSTGQVYVYDDHPRFLAIPGTSSSVYANLGLDGSTLPVGKLRVVNIFGRYGMYMIQLSDNSIFLWGNYKALSSARVFIHSDIDFVKFFTDGHIYVILKDGTVLRNNQIQDRVLDGLSRCVELQTMDVSHTMMAQYIIMACTTQIPETIMTTIQ